LIETQESLKDMQSETAKLGMSEIEKKYEDIRRAAERSRDAEIETARVRLGTNAKISDIDSKTMEVINRNFEERKSKQQAEAKNNYETSREFLTGWNDAYRQYVDAADNAANQARSLFQTMSSSMENALYNFVKTGKFNFADLANSVIDQIIRMEVQAMTSNIFGLMGGGGGAGGSGGGGGLLASAGKWLGGLMGFANGGPVVGGQPIIVGEKGPEIFTPNGGGSVTPNSQLGIGQATYNTYNYSISAIDSKSVAQLFAENRQILFGNVEQARKELPFRAR
jgi:lambda family phage tail tape measure protein